MNTTNEVIKELFNEKWHKDMDHYNTLSNRLVDPSYVVPTDKINNIHRAVLTIQYIQDNYETASRIVDFACGSGFNSCYLAKQGYDVSSCDVSTTAIEKAVALAESLSLPKDMFTLADQSFLSEMKDESIDVLTMLGLMRYLEEQDRDTIYKQAARILKPGGCLIVSNDNLLFDMFALNNITLNFWGETIEGFSDAEELFPNSTIREELEKVAPLPRRHYDSDSVSNHVKKHLENPLVYPQLMESYGFKLDKFVYPNCHLLPPLLEEKVDTGELESMKAKFTFLRSENDWRSMFMGHEFLGIFKK